MFTLGLQWWQWWKQQCFLVYCFCFKHSLTLFWGGDGSTQWKRESTLWRQWSGGLGVDAFLYYQQHIVPLVPLLIVYSESVFSISLAKQHHYMLWQYHCTSSTDILAQLVSYITVLYHIVVAEAGPAWHGDITFPTIPFVLERKCECGISLSWSGSPWFLRLSWLDWFEKHGHTIYGL